MLERITQAWRVNRPWIWRDVLIPFAATRCALLLVGWFSRYFPVYLKYPIREAVRRGWHVSPHRWLDIWARWDAGWYMSIVRSGYAASGDLHTTQSNVAFYPLYPYVVKLLALLIPAPLRTLDATLLIGILVSNAFLLVALVLLHKLVTASFNDESLARRTVLYLLLFPTGFFFSCFFTESTFLCMSVAAFHAASRKSWAVAAFFAGLLTLTRPQGVLIAAPLAWMYLASLGGDPRRIRWDAAWFLLIPLGLLAFLFECYRCTGDFLATFHVHAAWRCRYTMPWDTFLHPDHYNHFITPIDRVSTAGFLLLAVASLFLLPSAAYGIYALLIVSPLTFLGTLKSGARYCVVAFPVFIVLAMLGRRPSLHAFIAILFLVLQVLLMVAWCQLYWVG